MREAWYLFIFDQGHIYLRFSFLYELFFFSLTWVSGQLACTSTNPTGPEVNDHVSLQWPSYEQPHGSNLRPQKKQTSWSQVLITGSPPRWFINFFYEDGSWVFTVTVRTFLTWLLWKVNPAKKCHLNGCLPDIAS